MNDPGNINSENLLYRWAPLLVLLVLTSILYGQVLTFQFVHEDVSQIVENRYIQSASLEKLKEIIFSSGVAGKDEVINTYRPIFNYIATLEYSIFGPAPWGYHLVSLLLHLFNVVVVYLIAGRLLGPVSREGVSLLPLLAAAIFALHPLNTEVVIYISDMPDLLASTFFFLTFYLYILSSERRWLLVPAAAAFFISLLSKEPGLMVLPLIGLYDLSRGLGRGEGWSRVWGSIRYYLLFIAVALAYLFLRQSAVGGVAPRQNIDMTLFEVIVNIFPIISHYLSKLVMPVGLSSYYPFHPVDGPFDVRVIGSLSLLLIYLILMWQKRRSTVTLTTLGWLLVPLLPVLYFPVLTASAFADRFQYITVPGFAILMAHTTGLLSTSLEARLGAPAKKALGVVVILILSLYLAGTYSRSKVWRNDFTLALDTSLKNDTDPFVHQRIASLYHVRKEYDKAEESYLYALSLYPSYPALLFKLGYLYEETGRDPLALKRYKEVLQVEAGYRNVEERVGDIYSRSGDSKGAIGYYLRALALRGEEGGLRLKLAYAYYGASLKREALEEFKRVIEGGATGASAVEDALYNAAFIYSELGRSTEAIRYYKRLLEINPGSKDGAYNLGAIYISMGCIEEGLRRYAHVLSLDRGYLDVEKRYIEAGKMKGGGKSCE